MLNYKRFLGFKKPLLFTLITSIIILSPVMSFAQGVSNTALPNIGGVRIEFILFGLVLLGVALFHRHTFYIALSGLIVILAYKFIFDPNFHFVEKMFFERPDGHHYPFWEQILNRSYRSGEWGIILNLFGLLLGFSLLSKVFEESKLPDLLPNYLPNDWRGPFVLLFLVFILSSFLDNIAAALIGGTIALVVFDRQVHIGYIAAIVAASNAGGSWSVIGDTTTTMMWIDEVTIPNVLHAFIGAFTAILFFAYFASRVQDNYHRIQKDANVNVKIDWGKIAIVFLILVGAILSNFLYDMPALGVWIAILIGSLFRKMPWHEVPASMKGTIFLLCLVTSASLMPVEELPDAHWVTAFSLGFLSSVFDNIPLTKLCLDQGHYDWGVLAYTVGFGGSMIWFGSSAGVAITNKFPEGRNVGKWITKGWFVIVGYIIGFFALLFIWGWQPESNKKHKEPAIECQVPDCHVAAAAREAKKAKQNSTYQLNH